MTADEAAWLDRPDLPDGFERWRLEVPARSTRPTTAGEWAGALVRIETGTLEVGCLAGGHETFHAGDLLALGWLPIVELRNHGDVPVRLVAVRRRGSTPRSPYLHVTPAGDAS
jgi:hypothetical protein